PEEIRKKINFYNGDTLGRIYRIVPNHPLRAGDLKPNLDAATSVELVKQLANPNGWNRQTSHRLLLERQDHSADGALKNMAASGPSPESRVHSLWLLHAYSRLEPAEVIAALKDADPRVPENAHKLSEFYLKDSPTLVEEVIARAADPDLHVQFQAALTIGELKDRRALDTLAGLAHVRSSDPWFRMAILSSIADRAST